MSRWGDTEQHATTWFQVHGWPHARSGARPRTGPDIVNMDGLAPEVKAISSVRVSAWLKQATEQSAGGVPFVVWRPDRLGPASIERWPVLVRLDEFTWLLHRAGFGECVAGVTCGHD